MHERLARVTARGLLARCLPALSLLAPGAPVTAQELREPATEAGPTVVAAPGIDSQTFGALRARSIGPAVMSGRIAALDAVHGDELTWHRARHLHVLDAAHGRGLPHLPHGLSPGPERFASGPLVRADPGSSAVGR